MNKRILFFAVFLITVAMLLAACSSSQPTSDDHESDVGAEEHVEGDVHEDDEAAEGEEHAHIEPPAEYTDLTNPFVDDQETVEAGEVIYETYCAACHGPEGDGDGPAAGALDPKPSVLTDAHMMEELSDGYLFWRVSEGGAFEPFNSGMPAWKEILSEAEHWQVISFIRALGEDH